MLYVTVGLALMFGVFAFIGLRSIHQATDLVYQERLNAAYTTAGILERDFLHVARDVQESSPALLTAGDQRLTIVTDALLTHLSKTDPFPFFHVTGVWIVAPEGRLMAEAGAPTSASESDISSIASLAAQSLGTEAVVMPGVAGIPETIPFVTIVTRVSASSGAPWLLVAVHTVGLNSSTPYTPTAYWQAGLGGPASSTQPAKPEAEYHLEVVGPNGLVILGIGADERPGERSRHYSVIQKLMAEKKAATLLHKPASGDTFKPHVMAAVPLPSSGLYVALEQPADVALALPSQLQQQLILLTTLGFLATLVVAWVTTRHVVKPTEQLTSAARRIAQGDLTSPIEVVAQDEVGRLAESLETMRHKLRAAYEQVEKINKELDSQVKERTARLGEVLRKVISAQEEERYRLARELHDETAQTLGALSIALDRARDDLSGGSQQAVDRILEAKAIATGLLEDTRRLILDLRPMVLDDLGLGPAIRWYAETHLEEQRVAATVEVDRQAPRLPKHIEVSLFRVIQEAVNNITRHANAKHARIRLVFQDSRVSVLIADDGKGFDVGHVLGPGAPATSVGLLGMQERVRLLNGSIQIRSQEGKGTEILLEIPVPGEPA